MIKKPQSALALAKERPTIRTSDVTGMGVARVALTRLVRKGELVRIARGVYAHPERKGTEFDSLLDVAAQSQQGIFCLLTALRFHGLTTQSPFEIWLAIPQKSRIPRIGYPPVRTVWFSGMALTEGIETHVLDGQPVRIYGIAKTIADCFKYRNKIGIDVALEALHDAWKQRRVTMSQLYHFGKICRVEKIMRPYLESLV